MRDFTEPKALIPLRGEGGIHKREGILPVTRSKKDWVPRDDYRYRFLVGNAVEGKTCGIWMSRGCLEYEKHMAATFGLDGVEIGGKDVVEFFKSSCGRLGCPVCYEKAAAKEALKIAWRMSRFRIKGRNLKAIHVVVSPTEKDVAILSFSDLRKKAIQMAKACGVFGGSVIFHPFRKYNEDDFEEDVEEGFSFKTAPACWYLSPHFHIIGYGWVARVKENYEVSGWIVRNLGVRKSVRATALYQLSHCGVSPKFHTVVWFGALAYNKMKCVPLLPEDHSCPLCGSEMKKIIFKDVEIRSIVISKLEREGFYFFDHGLFEYVSTRKMNQRRYEGG